jgi:hypothetical protein
VKKVNYENKVTRRKEATNKRYNIEKTATDPGEIAKKYKKCHGR